MSVENGKVCCSCRHRIRIKDAENGWTWYRCDVKDMFLSNAAVMTNWCGCWAADKQFSKIEEILAYANRHLAEKNRVEGEEEE